MKGAGVRHTIQPNGTWPPSITREHAITAAELNAETVKAQQAEISRLNALLADRVAVWMKQALECKALRRALKDPSEVIVETLPADFKPGERKHFCESLDLVLDNRRDFTLIRFLLDAVVSNGESIDFMESA